MAVIAALDVGAQVDRFLEAVERFAESLARIELPYLAAALALSLALQLCRAPAWANALHAANPGDAGGRRPGGATETRRRGG